LTERFRRLNYGTLEIEITVDDPKNFYPALDFQAEPAPDAGYRIDRILFV